jgi:hypothetical protein
MQAKYDVIITPPSSYAIKQKATEQLKSNIVNEIPDNLNKVKKTVIRGMIKHDSLPNQQE